MNHRQTEGAAISAPTAKEPILSSPKGNILIVDDSLANLRLLTQMLAKRGYEVRPLTNGLQALEAARLMPPDLILLDIMMPEIDGYEVCERKFSMVLIGSETLSTSLRGIADTILRRTEAGFYFRVARGVKRWLSLIFTIMCTHRNILKPFKLAPALIR